MVGIPADEMIGRSMAELFPPELARKITDDDWAVVSSGQVFEVDEELNGRRYTTVKFPLAKKDKSLLAGFTMDITERRQAEAALHKSKEQFTNLASRINVGIYILHSTPSGSYSLDYVSSKMSELVNCSIENLLADCRIWFNNIHPDDRDGFVTMNQEGIALRRPFDWKGRLLSEGTVRWLHIQSLPELLMDGDVLWHGVVTDITESKLAEEKLQRRDAEIEQFIYTVSHDLRSPLVTVKTFLGYLEGDMTGGDRERIATDLQFIHAAADKMKMLLDELLELSRIDRVETPPAKVSLKETLADSLDALAGAISQRRADIHLPETDLILFGDRARLCQIWQNLIENAIKYSPAETPPRIELGLLQENGDTVFYVRDNGIGIDPQYHGKVFGVFEKLDPKSSGVGLGLTMIRRIVERYAGRVWVESGGTGQGSCFRFTLPGALVTGEEAMNGSFQG
jgi:signal transduction histidine kinase